MIGCIELTLCKRAVVHRAKSREHIIGAFGIGASRSLLAPGNSKHGPMVKHPPNLEPAAKALELRQRCIERTQCVVSRAAGEEYLALDSVGERAIVGGVAKLGERHGLLDQPRCFVDAAGVQIRFCRARNAA